ncbi:MAG: hypothetical protein IV100_33000 [Myxococcales bacterium]|nr:hypothetical protein [Myxococcales bacterium]
MNHFRVRFPLASATLVLMCLSLTTLSCDTGGSTEADRRGVGAECTVNTDCTEANQTCLTNFKGGYCGVKSCTNDAGCPDGSACVTHTDGTNYCFLVCDTKSNCNINRSAANESNCSGSITWADTDQGKACVPPSGN